MPDCIPIRMSYPQAVNFEQVERLDNPTDKKAAQRLKERDKQGKQAHSPPLAARSWAHAQSSLPHPLVCQLCRHLLSNPTLGAHRCSSTWIIPLQIIIPCALTLHLTFQSSLITYIISSPSCLQSMSQLSKTETPATTVNCKVHISVPNNSLCFPLQLAFQRAFKGPII